ncbi:LPS-assembly lipoprotein LptE [Comamonas composti]|uniref:LPS-assembly lipoprotein LptE n=1 Tax=Comamonas composti TaxID=408558 RepID=UPI000422794D|nr:LPS assembly lipoprotein LptE [Comamonas composti]
MQKRTLLTALALAPLLGACGFRLRGVPSFVFSSLYIQAPRGSLVARELQRNLASASDKLKLMRDPDSPDQAEAIFELISERQERYIVGMNAAGQIRELQLRLFVRFRLKTPNGDEPIAETEIRQHRDVTYNETQALSKEAEEAMLYKDMRTDIVQQLLRRLAAVKSLTP